jgi:hypothetical protein
VKQTVPFSFSINVTDNNTLSVDVSGVPTDAVVGQPYTGQLKVKGGIAPYTFTLNSALPDGLNLNSDGSITGTPTKAAVFSVSGTVSDSGT